MILKVHVKYSPRTQQGDGICYYYIKRKQEKSAVSPVSNRMSEMSILPASSQSLCSFSKV